MGDIFVSRDGKQPDRAVIVAPWNQLEAGVNTLSFKATANGFDNTWGITDLLVDTAPIINLNITSSLGATYGYYPLYTGATPTNWTRTWSLGERYHTRLYATFVNNGKDITLSFRGWGIDYPAEIGVYLNGVFLRHVTSSGVLSSYSAAEKIILRKENLAPSVNQISFRSMDNFNGFQSEKWGVTIDNFGNFVNIAPIIMFLMEEG